MRYLFLVLLTSIVLLSGCIDTQPICKSPYIEFKKGDCCLDVNNNGICDVEDNPTTTTTTLPECVLSLCDCKCHLRGTTIEEQTGRVCGINCREYTNVVDCKSDKDNCIEVYLTTTTTSSKTTTEQTTTTSAASTTTVISTSTTTTIACSKNNDCPSTPSLRKCKESGSLVYTIYEVSYQPICMNPMMPNSTCIYKQVEERLVESCEQYCYEGVCYPDECRNSCDSGCPSCLGRTTTTLSMSIIRDVDVSTLDGGSIDDLELTIFKIREYKSDTKVDMNIYRSGRRIEVLRYVSSLGYDKEFDGYKFKVNHIMYVHGNQPSSVFIDVERPDSSVVQAKVSLDVEDNVESTIGFEKIKPIIQDTFFVNTSQDHNFMIKFNNSAGKSITITGVTVKDYYGDGGILCSSQYNTTLCENCGFSAFIPECRSPYSAGEKYKINVYINYLVSIAGEITEKIDSGTIVGIYS